MKVDGLEFDWDAGNRQKCQKHSLSLRDIESIFQGPVSIFPDPEHSGEEERFIGIGKTEKHLSVFVVLRRKDDVLLIRPIRARFMHKKEIDYYEKETSKTEKRRGG